MTDEFSFDNKLTTVQSVKLCKEFMETTLTKFETCSHKERRGQVLPYVPSGASAALSQSQSSKVWIRPMRSQHGGHVTNQGPDHVIIWTNERGAEQLPPGANGNCRLLVDDSSSTDGASWCGGEGGVQRF